MKWMKGVNEWRSKGHEWKEWMHTWINKWIIDTTTYSLLSWGCRVSTSSQLGWSAGCCKSCRSKNLLVLYTFGIPMCSIFLDNLNLQVNLWLQIYLVFSPRSLGKWSNLTNFILTGLKSHHLQKALQKLMQIFWGWQAVSVGKSCCRICSPLAGEDSHFG